MTRNGWGSAPGDDRNCSRDAAPHGGSSGGLPWRVTVLALVVCLALAACSSSQGVSGQTPANSTTSGPRITVDMVTHGQAVRPVLGAGQEGRADGRDSLQRQPGLQLPCHHEPAGNRPRSSPRPPRQHPKGLVVTIPDAAVLSGPIKQAVSAGIPVIVMNVGAERVPERGRPDVRRPGRGGRRGRRPPGRWRTTACARRCASSTRRRTPPWSSGAPGSPRRWRPGAARSRSFTSTEPS